MENWRPSALLADGGHNWLFIDAFAMAKEKYGDAAISTSSVTAFAPNYLFCVKCSKKRYTSGINAENPDL